MSATVTASMRAVGWNVQFTIGPGSYPRAFAGIYQNPRVPTVNFGDVRDELALCFEFRTLDQNDNYGNEDIEDHVGRCNTVNNRDGDGGDNRGNRDTGGTSSWENIAFALTGWPAAEKSAATNEADRVQYPSWITQENLDEIVPGELSNPQQRRTVTYHIVRHHHCRLPSGSLLEDHLRAKCAQHLPNPDRRRHPAYLPHNRTPSDSRLNVMPLRRRVKARSQSPPKRTASGATSPGKPTDDADGEYDNMVAPASMGIDMDEARRAVNDFRMACVNRATNPCCAVSGDGAPWCPGQPIGPGVQACHIVPQQHYHLYPVTNSAPPAFEGDGSIEDSPRRLREAWQNTWSSDNGILLIKHIHDFFDSRLFSIHPETSLIRVFVPYQALERYHGREAQISLNVDRNALRHHYDMCCIENMAARRPNLDIASPLTSRMSTSGTSLVNTSGSGTPFNGRTDLPLTPSSGRMPPQTAMQLASDPSKRPRSTRDDREQGLRTNETELWEEKQLPQIKDEHGYSYVTPRNCREFLADVDWELQKLKGCR
ncbi:hypothetical protein LEL_10543 [Akanthomyces lecanii RCEF 1005]|uniref:HNH nuclease domain-containing protein n=1 Tax=Akanthomyces lecanii RCEF 1005 TaxID=1081108 RepID=A0A167XKT2_CORDF|nr:hypothetical protein LEL_10543 [Akanthomyces lecanii RCEF 1005]